MEDLDGNAIGGQLRCRNCGKAVIVLVTVRRTTCVDVAGFRLESIS